MEKLAYSNMLLVEALVELLDEKSLLTKAEVMERVKKLKAETKVDPHGLAQRTAARIGAGLAVPRPRKPM